MAGDSSVSYGGDICTFEIKGQRIDFNLTVSCGYSQDEKLEVFYRFPTRVTFNGVVYSDLKYIGRGAYGWVHRFSSGQSHIAVKIEHFPLNLVTWKGAPFEKESRDMFANEATFNAVLFDQAVVDCNMQRGDPVGYLPLPIKQNAAPAVLVMPYFQGETYHQLFSVFSKNLELFLQYQIAVAKTIIALHAQNIIHNDIQGANIIIEKNGSQVLIHLIDFACARFLGEPIHLYVDPKYLAPETKQTENSVRVFASPALDVYAFGSLMDAYLKYLETTPEVKSQLAAIIKQCQDVNPQARPSLSTVIQQLKTVKPEEPVVAPTMVEPVIAQSQSQSTFFKRSPLKQPLLDEQKSRGCLKQCCVIL